MRSKKLCSLQTVTEAYIADKLSSFRDKYLNLNSNMDGNKEKEKDPGMSPSSSKRKKNEKETFKTPEIKDINKVCELTRIIT